MNAVVRPVLPVSNEPLRLGLRWSISALGFVILVCLFLIASELATDPRRFPVLNVDVEGTLDYTDRERLSSAVELHTKLGFYGMDVDDIRADVENLPWVAQAHIRRVWPARLLISIEEHEPAARFNDNALVSKGLELFKPPQLEKDNPQYLQWRANFASLPELAGVEGRHEFILDAYRQYNLALSRFGVSVDSLIEDERHSQTLELSNQITLRIGYEAHELRLQRFIDVYERLVVPLDGQPAAFDMRYSNGFALSGGGLIGESN